MATRAVAPSRPHKAARLVREGKVHRLAGARVYRVEGDTDTYTVVLSDVGDFCSCEWGRRQHEDPRDCAHVLAAKVDEHRTDDPFDGVGSHGGFRR